MSFDPLSRARFDSGYTDEFFGTYPRWRNKVLLREPEVCKECGQVFQSLYPIRNCSEHDGLESI